ncbi:MAG: hypothetical protein RLZZ186_1039, partial [Cyanobacteriota bacterium]
MIAAMTATPVFALPEGASVVEGRIQFSQQDPATLLIQQASQRAAADFRSFNIGAGEQVLVQQPSAQSLLLARVTGGLGPSQLNGLLQANGGVLLLNPQGVLIGPQGQIDTASFMASTLSAHPAGFSQGGPLQLVQDSQSPGGALIQNAGSIKVSEAGLVALVGPNVINDGLIHAQLGQVVLASGQTATLDVMGDGLINLAVNGELAQSLVRQQGQIAAAGGQVWIGASHLSGALASVVNVGGIVQANAISDLLGGSTTVPAPAGKITVAGQAITLRGTLEAQNLAGLTNAETSAFTDQAVIAADTTIPLRGVGLDLPSLLSGQETPTTYATAQATATSSASRSFYDGTITVAGEQIDLIGAALRVDGIRQAGQINLTASPRTTGQDATSARPGAIRIDPGSRLTAQALAGSEAGRIAINSDHLTIAGSISADGLANGSHGGAITLTGSELTLAATANLSATGRNGGGTIQVGGSWQNSNPTIRQATSTTIAAGAVLNASAIDRGDGGTIVTWSDITKANSVTTVSGTLLAKGGAEGGVGGRIETSGYDLRVDDIRVDTTAAAGETGLWLLDPYNITISEGTQAGVDGSFSGTADSAVVNATTLTTALNSSNVTVSTGGLSTGAQAGDITVATAISSGSANKLTLDAYRHINLNAAITRSGAGGLELKTATGAVAGSGAISIGAGGLTFNVGGTNSSNYTGDISGTGALIKSGTGTQTLAGRGDMTGGTTVQAGTLRLVPGSAEGTNRFRWANGEQTITVNSGAVLELAATAGNSSNQTYLESGRSLTLNGSGTVKKTGTFSLEMGWNDRRFIVSQASDGLFQVAEGQVSHNYTRDNWRNNQGVLQIDSGTTFDTYSENVYISGLTGGGLLQNTYGAGGNKAIYITNSTSAANYTYSGIV